jgi:hypothetical protein|tara:strand:+ start:358 stop:528 length:171 start_codon:yes stop_codon:yes gene_type:complete
MARNNANVVRNKEQNFSKVSVAIADSDIRKSLRKQIRFRVFLFLVERIRFEIILTC